MCKICPLTNKETRCTDSCRGCAKELYYKLKSMAGKSEYVSEEAIRNDLGNEEFELLRTEGFIECCTVIEGRKMYAI